MTNSVDLEEPICSASILCQEEPSEAFVPTLLSRLADTKSCGLFMLIEKLLNKTFVSNTTAHLALDLLRRINHSPIVITPSLNDDPDAFIATLFIKAQEIVTDFNDSQGPLYASAKHLIDCFEGCKKKEMTAAHLEACWQNFTLHFYREKLYRLINR